MNEILLATAAITFFAFFQHCSSIRLVGAAAGFTSGLFYFTLVPTTLLRIYGYLPGIDGTRVPGVSWSQDSALVTTLLTMVILTVVSMTLTLKWFPQKSIGRFDKFFENFAFPISDQVVFLLYFVVTTVLFFATGLGTADSHWATSRNEFMAEQGSLGGLLVAIPTALKYIILFRLAPRLFSEHRPVGPWSIMLATLLFDLYTSGTRIFLFQFLALMLFDRLRDRDFRVVFFLILSALPIAAAMEVYTVARTHIGRWEDRSVSSAFAALQTGITKSTERMQEKQFYGRTLTNITEASSLGVFKWVYFTYGSRRPYLAGITIAKPLFAWIPRDLWPDKPVNFSYIIGQEVVGEGVSVGGTSLGEFYGNFGLLGGIVPPFLLLLYVYMFAHICRRNTQAFPYIVFVYGIATARNGFMESAIPLLISLIALNVIGYSNKDRSSVKTPVSKA